MIRPTRRSSYTRCRIRARKAFLQSRRRTAHAFEDVRKRLDRQTQLEHAIEPDASINHGSHQPKCGRQLSAAGIINQSTR